MRLALILLATSLASLALAPAAGALVQVDRGIAGARLNNTKKEVRAALGRPRTVIRGNNDFGKFLEYRYRGGIRVSFQGRKHVSGVSTVGRGDRTRRNIGVGSTEAQVAAKVAGVTCETIAGFRSCHTHDFLAGQRVTDFQIVNGKVTRVSVGFVID
jgi:hypothetical protein